MSAKREFIPRLVRAATPTLEVIGQRCEVVVTLTHANRTTTAIHSQVAAQREPCQLTFHYDAGGHITRVERRTFTAVKDSI